MINQTEQHELKEKIKAQSMKYIDDDPFSIDFIFDDQNIPPPQKIYLDQGILKVNKDLFYLTQAQANEIDLNRIFNHNFQQEINFSYSCRFLEMMFINNTSNMVDRVTRGILDFSRGDWTNI
jgi:hypothetical protein